MSQTETNDPIPITIHLMPSTVEKLKEISIYLYSRHNQENPIERVIKSAIADYFDVMTPLSEKKKLLLKLSLLMITSMPLRIDLKKS